MPSGWVGTPHGKPGHPSWLRHLLIITVVAGLIATSGSTGDSGWHRRRRHRHRAAAVDPAPSFRGSRATRSASRPSARTRTTRSARASSTATRTGIKAYFDYRNSEGGIDGRKLVLSKKLDDELAEEPGAGARGGLGQRHLRAPSTPPQLATGWADLADAGIPTYVWAINPAQATGKTQIFGNREVVCIDLHPARRRLRGEAGRGEEGRLARLRRQRQLQAVRASSGRRRSSSTAEMSGARPSTPTTTWPSGCPTASAPRSRR